MFDQLAKFGALLATAVTGIGYLIGLVAVGGFSDELGVSASDLDLAFRDYLVMAAGWIAVSSALAGFFVAYVALAAWILQGAFHMSIARTRQWATGTLAVLAAALVVLSVVAGGRDLLAAGLLFVAPAIIGFAAARRSDGAGQGSEVDHAGVDSRAAALRWYRSMVVAAVVVGVIAGPLYGRSVGRAWARALLAEMGAQEQAALESPGIEWLRDLAIFVQPGLVETGSEESCVTRIQDRVFITKPSSESDDVEVMVLSSWDRFIAKDC